jgi:hypothetical protein
MENTRKKVFISYSWDNIEHQRWVLKLASDLMKTYGIDVILDQYELSAGKDLTHFMENSIEKADKVLVILSPNYKTKAESRESGVGYETSMISQEIFESPITNVKFIPVLRVGNATSSAPKFLRSKLYHSMVDDKNYNYLLFDLAKIIYDNELIEKPELGPIPDFKTQNVDPIIELANSLKREEDLNSEIDRILHSQEGAEIAENELQILVNILKSKIETYQNTTDLRFGNQNNRDQFILSCSSNSVSFYWRSDYYGTVDKLTLIVKYWDGIIRINNWHYFPGEEPKAIKVEEYRFDLDYQKQPVWKLNDKVATTEELTRIAFIFLLEKVQNEKVKKFRGK